MRAQTVILHGVIPSDNNIYLALGIETPCKITVWARIGLKWSIITEIYRLTNKHQNIVHIQAWTILFLTEVI